MHVKHFGIYHYPTNTLMPHKNASVSHRYWNPQANNNRQGPKLWSNKKTLIEYLRIGKSQTQLLPLKRL